MEPVGKRRKLAPKLNASASSTSDSHSSQHHHILPHPSHIVPDAPRHSQRQEFEAFVRHLHDAAIFINRQTKNTQHEPRQQHEQHEQVATCYSDVSVLLLSWQGDASADPNVRELCQLFESQYRYRTEAWQIPRVSNPSIKLAVRMAAFLEHASPDQLLIIYYAGHGFIGSDDQLYWACPQEDSIRLKWAGVRCLFEQAQSDMLLLLDTCSSHDHIASNQGVKQVIAAQHASFVKLHMPSSRSYFTPCLIEALHKLSSTPSFSSQQLYHEITVASQLPSGTYGPDFFTMTPDKGKNIQLAPSSKLSLHAATLRSAKARLQDSSLNPQSGPKLAFNEARVLVCTTFAGEASPDMSAFNIWLQNTAPLASQITVEGMFSGPSTVLLISMPTSLWASVQHDNMWYTLGTITSRNMSSFYNTHIGPRNLEEAETEANVRAISSLEFTAAESHRNSTNQRSSIGQAARDANTDGQTSPTARLYQSLAAGGLGINPKTEGADSVEMQEAAEQLKALSHVRHRSGDANTNPTLQRAALPGVMPSLHPGFRTLSRSESMPVLDGGSGSVGAKIKRILGKPDIRCAHCSHAPFKDSSSLRKHIAAAHTRPFPCAFHFGGCNSTFGSKNEWKRHIASQHLCLQFYRCSVCLRTSADGKGNEFNRKDLFTQHLRRMHAPPQVKQALAKGDSGQQSDWDAYVKEMQQSCLIQRRLPPQRSHCPKPGCTSGFEGPTAWDEWTEHVGRHMEKGEGDNLGVDSLLRQYALDEGIIEPIGEGQFRLCPTLANGSTASQSASQTVTEAHDAQVLSTQSTAAPLEDLQPWGRSLPPLTGHALPLTHATHDRRPSQPSE